MFYRARDFNQDLSWNTTSVKDMSYMFNGYNNFNRKIYTWNTTNVKDMKYGGEKKRRVGEKTATKIATFIYISDIDISNN